MEYSIDTSALMEGWHRLYPPKVFPSLWARLDELIEQDNLVATEEVLHELEKKDDEIYRWARQRERMFIPIDEDVQLAVQKILQGYKKLLDTRKNRSGADPFVIALASVRGCCVVTQEGKTGSLSRPNIPDVCEALHIRCVNLIQLIEEQGWVFGS